MMMADKGINIQDLVAKKDTNKINVPPRLTTKKKQMPVLDAERTGRIAELYIHVDHP